MSKKNNTLKNRSSRRRENSCPHIFSIGGGKGGIGKSFLTTNLAISSAKFGYKTLVIDLDFGGANAHTYLEVKVPPYNVFDFLKGDVKSLSEIAAPTPFKDLNIIAGKDSLGKNTDVQNLEIEYLFHEVRKLDYDRVFFDLGAGTNFETIHGYLHSDFKLTLSTPEPTSIENTYHFLKKSFYEHLKLLAEEHDFSEQINSILKSKGAKGLKNPAQLLKFIGSEYGKAGSKIVQGFQGFKPLIVINQCRTPQDYKLGESLAQICRKYFGLEARLLGHLGFENHVWQSVRTMKPLSIEYPHCLALKEIEEMMRKLNSIEKNDFYRYSMAV